MVIVTAKFGPIEVGVDEVIHFPAGLLGLEECRYWVILADAQNDSVAWMQCIETPEIAVPVVSPRRFVPDFRMKVSKTEWRLLHFEDGETPEVVVIAGECGGDIYLNLKAPVIVNLSRKLGRQVITNGDLPIRLKIGMGKNGWKKSA